MRTYPHQQQAVQPARHTHNLENALAELVLAPSFMTDRRDHTKKQIIKAPPWQHTRNTSMLLSQTITQSAQLTALTQHQSYYPAQHIHILHPSLYIWRTSLPFISGRSVSHSSLSTAYTVSATSSVKPRLHTSVIA